MKRGKYGMKLNLKKTKLMRICRQGGMSITVKINETMLK